MGICLIVGGSKCLPGLFGALMQWKLKFKWVFACVKEGVKACQDALGHLSPSKQWFDKVPVCVRGGCRSKLHGSKVHGVRARTPGYFLWIKGSLASVKHVLDKNMPIQHLRQLADTKKQFWKIWNEAKMYGRASSYAVSWCKSARRTTSYAGIISIY